MKQVSMEFTYRSLPALFYIDTAPAKVLDPHMVVHNKKLWNMLGGIDLLSNIQYLSGNEMPAHGKPLSMAYAGHQFGYFTMLGDGRAHLIGEIQTQKGERYDIQLKGSGRTPFSRGGDGKAALGPMLREYIISEAMHALGIPTTRSLAVITSGEQIMRESPLPGAILVRVASSHIRVGTFSYASAFGTTEDVRCLADYTLHRHFPHLISKEHRYLELLRTVIDLQASLIAKWMLVGFIHGVMNTDNMAISGETIDYGPCAFMDTYHPASVFSSIDTKGRYAYQNQPEIAKWNLTQFAIALLPLLHEDEEEAAMLARTELARFHVQYESNYLAGMQRKLGLTSKSGLDDTALIHDLLNIMEKHKLDYTVTLRNLSSSSNALDSVYGIPEMMLWLETWEKRRSMQSLTKEQSIALMNENNPRIIPRNHKVEEALAAADAGEFSLVMKLLDALAHPFVECGYEDFVSLPPCTAAPYRTFCGT